jgi:hypothetical protein
MRSPGIHDLHAPRVHETDEEYVVELDAADFTVVYARGTLELHAPRIHPEARRLPLEHRPYRSNPNAVPC